MNLYNNILINTEFLEVVEKIDKIKFINEGKWDWEHGLGHAKRVANYVQQILLQLNADERTIELGMAAALLHDIGLSKGDKANHAIESSKIFTMFLDNKKISKEETEIIKQAIIDHSNGNNIQSLIGLSLALADKLDVTYYRTINSSIQDEMNIEIQKIKNVEIEITKKDLIVKYTVDNNFNAKILQSWPKSIILPLKSAKYLNKHFIFLINGKKYNYNLILS